MDVNFMSAVRQNFRNCIIAHGHPIQARIHLAMRSPPSKNILHARVSVVKFLENDHAHNFDPLLIPSYYYKVLKFVAWM